jgi:hypothetical protein
MGPKGLARLFRRVLARRADVAIRSGDSERGQALIIAILGMGLVLAMAAFAIDVAQWYQQHHQAQVSADASALAAANCLANESSANTGTNSCTTPMDTTRAGNVATSIASANNVPIQSVTYGTSTSGTSTTITSVTVKTATTPANFFSGLVGARSIGATASASVSQGSSDCTSAGNGCLLFYAAKSSCSANAAAITIQVGNSVSFNGGILTNGYVDDSAGNGGTFNGPISYGAGNGCATKDTFKSGSTFTDGMPTAQTTNLGSSSTPNWPLDYSTIFPACSSGGTYQCTGPNGTPSYCTYAAANYTTTTSNGVYCAYGTSATKSDPATWNGSIVGGNSGSVTLIGGTITLNSNTVLTAYSHNLIAYATSSSSSTAAFTGTGGNLTWTGDIFAPNGLAAITNGNVNFTGFVEAQTITDNGGDQTGGGPNWSGGPTAFPGSDTLTG